MKRYTFDDLLDNLCYYIAKFSKKINFIPYDKWYYRIINILYFPLRMLLIFIFCYISSCMLPFIMLISWIVKGEI